MKKLTWLWIGLGILGIASPLGLLASGTAWGEWGKDAIVQMLGYVPEGFSKLSEIWKAPFADYTLRGTPDHIGYIISAFIGMIVIIGLTWGIMKLVVKKNK